MRRDIPEVDLRSDNTSGVAPEILTAIAAANEGRSGSYGTDQVTLRAQERIREIFEHPKARIFPVTTGTAANALALSAASPPWGAVLCRASSHVMTAECGAVPLMGGGLVTQPVADLDDRIDPAALASTLASTMWGDAHVSQPTVLSLTVPTEEGASYQPDEIAQLSSIAAEYSLRVHLDGARLANALVATGSTPAELTWRAGVDVVSLGATKNGALACEVIVAFDDAIADQLSFRTQRTGHVPSKMRFVSAQLNAYLTDGLWLRLAAISNERMAQLLAGVAPLVGQHLRILGNPTANICHAEVSPMLVQGLEGSGILFHPQPGGRVRFVTSWQTTPEEVAAAIDRLVAIIDTLQASR